jgi:glycosyltransferase involved in cell wall biosynthesis
MLDRKLSLVLPAHNEADNIQAVVERAIEVLPRVAADWEVIIVDDGSQDDTGALADRLAVDHACVRVVHHPRNQGYGAALQSGFRAATGEAVMFMDADQQFDIAEITALLPYVPHYDIVAGYRIQRQDPLYRRLYGKLFGLAVAILFGLRMRDIDCAFKILHADVLRGLELSTPGALINTELLVRARRRGATIVQVGVHHYPRYAGASSGGSPRVVFRAVGETVRLWWRLRREDSPPAPHTDPEIVGGTGSVLPRLALAMFVVLAALGVWILRRRGQ